MSRGLGDVYKRQTLGGAGWAVRATTELAGLLPPSAAGAGAGAGVGVGGGGSGPSSELRYVRQQVDAVANVPMEETGAVVFSVGASAGEAGGGGRGCRGQRLDVSYRGGAWCGEGLRRCAVRRAAGSGLVSQRTWHAGAAHMRARAARR